MSQHPLCVLLFIDIINNIVANIHFLLAKTLSFFSLVLNLIEIYIPTFQVFIINCSWDLNFLIVGLA